MCSSTNLAASMNSRLPRSEYRVEVRLPARLGQRASRPRQMGADKLPAVAKKSGSSRITVFLYKFFLQQRRNTFVEYSLGLRSHARFGKLISERSFSPAFSCILWLTYIFHKRPDDPVGTVLPVENTGVVAEWEPLPSLPSQKPVFLPSRSSRRPRRRRLPQLGNRLLRCEVIQQLTQ